MMRHVRNNFPHLPISLELEKAREGIEYLFEFPQLLLCSRGFARYYGFDAPQDFLLWMRERAPQAEVMVAWGENGAYGLDETATLCHAPAQPPLQVRDTLGAGDTFNAGIIAARLDDAPLAEALQFACGLAGRKCGVVGFGFPVS